MDNDAVLLTVTVFSGAPSSFLCLLSPCLAFSLRPSISLSTTRICCFWLHYHTYSRSKHASRISVPPYLYMASLPSSHMPPNSVCWLYATSLFALNLASTTFLTKTLTPLKLNLNVHLFASHLIHALVFVVFYSAISANQSNIITVTLLSTM